MLLKNTPLVVMLGLMRDRSLSVAEVIIGARAVAGLDLPTPSAYTYLNDLVEMAFVELANDRHEVGPHGRRPKYYRATAAGAQVFDDHRALMRMNWTKRLDKALKQEHAAVASSRTTGRAARRVIGPKS